MLVTQDMIHTRTLGDVLCENIKSLASTQTRVLFQSSQDNPVKSCQDPSRGKISFEALVQHILWQQQPQAKPPPEPPTPSMVMAPDALANDDPVGQPRLGIDDNFDNNMPPPPPPPGLIQPDPLQQEMEDDLRLIRQLLL